jgi:hypothetical protein
MNEDERRWGADVYARIIEATRANFSATPPCLDISVAHRLGFTPAQTADALTGNNAPVLARIVQGNRELGLLGEEPERGKG